MYIKNVVVSRDKELANKFLKDQGISWETRERIAVVTNLLGLHGFDPKRTKFIKVGTLPKSLDDMLKRYESLGAEIRYVTLTEVNDE